MSLSEREQTDLVKKLVKETSLGRDGAIYKTLVEILDAIKDIKINEKTLSKSFNSALQNKQYTGKEKNSQLTDTEFRKTLKNKQDLNASYNILNTHLRRNNKELGKFSESIYFASKRISSLSLSFFNFSKVTDLIEISNNVYREFFSSGMTFNGSMMQMNLAVSEAAMTFDEFKSTMIANSNIVARMGGPQVFGGLQRQVRLNLMQFSGLGLTITELNDLLSSNFDNMQFFGFMETNQRRMAARAFEDLIVQTTSLSSLTGRNRRDILAEVNASSRNIHGLTALSKLPQEQAQLALQTFNNINSLFSSIGEKTGSFFSNALMESLGPGGLAQSDFGIGLVEAGLGQFVPLINGLTTDFENLDLNDAASLIDNFRYAVKNNINTLAVQSRTGNQAATQALEMYFEMQKTGKSGLELVTLMEKKNKELKALEPLTSLFQNFKEIIATARSSFSTSFFKTLTERLSFFTESLQGEKLTEFMDMVSSKFEMFGIKAANFMTSFLPKNPEEAGKVLDKFFIWVEKTTKFLINDFFPFTTKLVDAVTYGIGALKKLFDWAFKIGNLFSEENASAIGSAIAAGILIFLPKILATVIGSTLKYLARKAIGVGMGEAAGLAGGGLDILGKVGSLGSMGKKLLSGLGKGGIVGIVTSIIGLGIDALLPEFAGKDSITSALEFGGIGATIGSIFGPVGAVVGGLIGGVGGIIYENWDSITEGISNFISGIGDWASGVWDWTKNTFGSISETIFNVSPIGVVYNNWDMIKENIGGFLTGLGNWFSSVTDWFSNIFSSITSVVSDVGNFISSKFAWLNDIDWSKTISAYLGGDNTLLGKAFNKIAGVQTNNVPVVSKQVETASTIPENKKPINTVNEVQKTSPGTITSANVTQNDNSNIANTEAISYNETKQFNDNLLFLLQKLVENYQQQNRMTETTIRLLTDISRSTKEMGQLI